MQKITIMTALTLVIGCATHSDIQNLQIQTDNLRATVVRVTTDVANAKISASDAKAAAKYAVQFSQDTGNKFLNLRPRGCPK
jgi:murein lipoprotein